MVKAFKQAWEAADIAALISLLDPRATVTGDLGGLPAALPGPLQGAEQIARTCLAVASQAPGLTLLERTVNGQPGLIAQQNRITVMVYAFEITGDQITRIWAILNPDKLRPWAGG
jgi:RNA polymerase sigma-70 factor (ECF subfamily)